MRWSKHSTPWVGCWRGDICRRLRHNRQSAERKRLALRVFMLAKKVGRCPVWKPIHKHPVYDRCACYTNGIEEGLFKVGFGLPAGAYVTDEDVVYIVDCIKEVLISHFPKTFKSIRNSQTNKFLYL